MVLKAVAQVIMVYAISIFKLPKKCVEISDAIWKFWWEDDANKSKDTLVCFAGSTQFIPKNMGGLGFLYPHCFNVAMPAKQV